MEILTNGDISIEIIPTFYKCDTKYRFRTYRGMFYRKYPDTNVVERPGHYATVSYEVILRNELLNNLVHLKKNFIDVIRKFLAA